MPANAWNVPTMIGNMCAGWGGRSVGDNEIHCHMYAWGGCRQTSQVQHMDHISQLPLPHKPPKPPSQHALLSVNVTGFVRGLIFSAHLPNIYNTHIDTHIPVKYNDADERGSLIWALLFWSDHIHKWTRSHDVSGYVWRDGAFLSHASTAARCILTLGWIAMNISAKKFCPHRIDPRTFGDPQATRH